MVLDGEDCHLSGDMVSVGYHYNGVVADIIEYSVVFMLDVLDHPLFEGY